MWGDSWAAKEECSPPKGVEDPQTVETGVRGGPNVMCRNIMGNEGRSIRGSWP